MSEAEGDLWEAVQRLRAQQQQGANASYNQMYETLFGVPPASSQQQQAAGNSYNTHPPKWSTIEEMRQYMRDHPPGQSQQQQANYFGSQQQYRAAPKAETVEKDPIKRRKQINDELDIIRGVIPTPKGYTIDPRRAKALMVELKQLPT